MFCYAPGLRASHPAHSLRTCVYGGVDLQEDVRLWLETFGPPEVTQTTWRLYRSKIDPCLQCRHHPRYVFVL
jgi:hypothetical protein